MIRVGVAADHRGWELKNDLSRYIEGLGHPVTDFGAKEFNPDDDYPDFVIPLARAVAMNQVDRGIAVCGSGVGACIAANKVDGVRAALIHELFSARQGVEDDNMNLLCLGARVLTHEIASELVRAFLAATFKGGGRFQRRLDKINQQANGKA
jgi:ribose 5-phosphate isomerase B